MSTPSQETSSNEASKDIQEGVSTESNVSTGSSAPNESDTPKGQNAEGVPNRAHKTFALAGNPNSGKTTLFNELTGTNQHVGNWPGVTVTQKVGHLKPEYGDADIVDLPGIYSLNSYSIEERVTRSYIVNDKPDVVINVVEATNIERNLFLTCQIAELGVPMVVAVNMMDEAAKAGDHIDVKKLSKLLGLPVVPITAVTGEGVIELMHTAGMHNLMSSVELESTSPYHAGEDDHGHGFGDSQNPEQHRLEYHTDDEGRTNALISAYKYHNHYKGPMTFQPTEGHPVTEEQETENANRRYKFIDSVISKTVQRGRDKEDLTRSDKIDRVLTNRYAGIPIFLLIMFFVFHCTFSDDFLGLSMLGIGPIPAPGVALQDLAQMLVDAIPDWLEPLFPPDTWMYGLVIDGICAGVGSVLSFLPQICVLFFFLTLLEDMGYMARAAFIMDRAMRIFGLSGKSFVPLLMGFGCNVPAMMACRTMESERDRLITLFIIPFIGCGSRAFTFLVFGSAFFPENADMIMFLLYLLGLVVALACSVVLSKIFARNGVTPLILELPRYRPPRLKSLGLALWGTIKNYLHRAGTVIFFASIVIWFLSSFGFSDGGFGMVDTQESILVVLGSWLSVIFQPLGFGLWAATASLIAGFFAKETIVSTLGVLASSVTDADADGAVLSTASLTALGFTPSIAISYMVFLMLYLPCMATVATMRRESNSLAWTWAQIGVDFGVAYVCSFIVYHIVVLFV